MRTQYPEPDWGIPQEAFPPASSFCLAGPTPFLLTGVLIRLLQYHFSDKDNIEEELLKEYIWSQSRNCHETIVTDEDGATQTIQPSKITISPSYGAVGDTAQANPAMYVKREAFRTERVSLQDQSLVGLNSKGIFEGREHQVNVIGAHSIICKGATGAEADLLGQEVFFRMLHYQQVIKRDFALGNFQTQGCSETREKKNEAKTTFYTAVRLDWAYVYRWLVIPETPVVKRVDFEYRES